MNYGQYETERRLKSLSSKTGKYTSKLVFNIFKAFFILFLFLAVAGAAVGFGMIKGIIDNAPSVDIMNIQPDRFATTVYDADGNLTETLVTSGSNRESATYEELPENLVNAFVAIEDSRFWTHDGIDLRSIARAVKGVVQRCFICVSCCLDYYVADRTYCNNFCRIEEYDPDILQTTIQSLCDLFKDHPGHYVQALDFFS